MVAGGLDAAGAHALTRTANNTKTNIWSRRKNLSMFLPAILVIWSRVRLSNKPVLSAG